jgi:hypothetical protein
MWNAVRSSYEALIARCLIDDYAGYTVSGYGHGGVAGASGQYGWVTTGEDLYPGNIPAQLSAQEFGAYGWPFAFWTNNTAGTMDTGIGQHETRLLNSKYLQFTLANKSAIALLLMSSPSGDTYQVTVNGAVISTNTTYYSTTNGNGDTGNYPLLCWIQNPPTNCAIVLSNTATDSGVVDFIGFGWVESTNSGIPSYVRSKQIILGSPVADNYEGASDLVLYRMANCAYDACSVFGGQYPVWFANNYNAWVSNTDQEPVDPAHFTPAGAWQVAKNFASATKASGGKDLNFVDLHGGQFFGDSFISLGAGFNGTFTGNGGPLTNLNGAALVSPINQTNLPAVAITNGEAATLVLPLSALSQSSASTGQYAEWNGSAWVPATVSGGGGGGSATYYNQSQLWTNTAGQIGLLSGAWLTNVTEWGTPEFTNAAATVYPLYFLATTGTYAPSFDFGGVEDWQFGLSSSSFYIASMYPTANVPLVTLFNGANPMLAVDYQLQLDNGANVYAGGLTNNTPLGFIGNGGGLTNINGAALVSPINQTNLPAVAITNGEAATLVLPLSALSQSSATTGQLAEWNGSAWVSATVSGGGGAVYYNADQIWTNAASQISILTAADLTNINGFGTTSLGGGTTTIDGSGNASFAGGIMGQTLSTSGAINIGSQINGNGSGLNNVPLSGLGSSSATTGNWIGFGASSWGVGTTLTNLALNFGVDVKGKTTVSNLVVASSAMIGTNLTVSYGNVTLAAGPDEFSDQGGNADLWSTSLGIVTISKAAAGDALGTLDAATVNASAGMSNGGVYIAATSTATNVSGPAGTTNVQSGVTNQVVNSSGTQTNGFPKFLAAQVLHSSAYGSWATNQGGIGIFTNYGNACDNFASLEIIYTNATTTTYGTKFATYTFAFPYSSPPCVNDFEGLANDVNGRPSVMYAVTTSTTMTLYFTALVTPTTGGKYTNMFTITGM